MLRWIGENPTFRPMLELSGAAENVTIQDVVFDSPYRTSHEVVRAIQPRGRNITVRRCGFGSVGAGIMAEGRQAPVGLLTMDCVAGTIGGYFVWGEGSDHVHVGNTVGGSVDQHNLRLVAKRVLVAHNDLTNTRKSAVWCQIGRYAWIGSNVVREAPIQVGPIPTVGEPSDRWRWAVIENNQVLNDSCKVFHGAEHVIVRNNIVHADGIIAYEAFGHDVSMRRTAVDVRFVHNTAINTTPHGRFLKLGPDTEEIVVANNLYWAPALATGDGSANTFILDGDLDGVTFHGNLWAEPATVGWGDGWHYLWPSWSHAGGYRDADQWRALPQVRDEHHRRFGANDLDDRYRPTFDAVLSPPVRGVHVDFHGARRPVTGMVTVGAVR